MFDFIHKIWFRILYLIIGIFFFLLVYYSIFVKLERTKNPWFIFLAYISASILIHGIFSMKDKDFQNERAYLFGALSWVSMFIFTAIFASGSFTVCLWGVYVLFIFAQIGLFLKGPTDEKIKEIKKEV